MHKLTSSHHGRESENDDLPVMGRRQALQLLGSVGIGAGLAGSAGCHPDREAASANAPATTIARTLSESDFSLLSRLTELIIPKTDTAGAIEAGVPEFIDAALARITGKQVAVMSGSTEVFGDNLPVLFADGLQWIEGRAKATHGKSFLELGETQQFALLESSYTATEVGRMGGRSAQFLRALKILTVEGYYTSRAGLLVELSYKGNIPHEGSHEGCKSQAV